MTAEQFTELARQEYGCILDGLIQQIVRGS